MTPLPRRRTYFSRLPLKMVWLVILFKAMIIPAQSQSIHYQFNASNSGYNTVTGGNTVFTSYTDDAISSPITIGFGFRMGDSMYTQCKISSNGFISFNNNAVDSYVNGLATVGGTNLAPLVAPLWDDLQVSSTGSIVTNVTGSAPNRVFTVEWKNMEWDFNAQTSVVSFQVKLYETVNRIEFAYKDNGFTMNTASASAGIAGTLVADYYSITNFSNAPIASQLNETNDIAEKPATGQLYQWQQTMLVPVTLLTFDALKNRDRISIAWQTTTEVNSAFFIVERSLDGRNYLPIQTMPASKGNAPIKTYGVFDYHPAPGKNYYRLKIVDLDNSYSYGPAKVIDWSAGKEISFPTIITSSFIPIRFSESPGQYRVSILTTDAAMLSTRSLEVRGNHETVAISLPVQFSGNAIIQVQSTDGRKSFSKLVIIR